MKRKQTKNINNKAVKSLKMGIFAKFRKIATAVSKTLKGLGKRIPVKPIRKICRAILSFVLIIITAIVVVLSIYIVLPVTNSRLGYKSHSISTIGTKTEISVFGKTVNFDYQRAGNFQRTKELIFIADTSEGADIYADSQIIAKRMKYFGDNLVDIQVIDNEFLAVVVSEKIESKEVKSVVETRGFVIITSYSQAELDTFTFEDEGAKPFQTRQLVISKSDINTARRSLSDEQSIEIVFKYPEYVATQITLSDLGQENVFVSLDNYSAGMLELTKVNNNEPFIAQYMGDFEVSSIEIRSMDIPRDVLLTILKNETLGTDLLFYEENAMGLIDVKLGYVLAIPLSLAFGFGVYAFKKSLGLVFFAIDTVILATVITALVVKLAGIPVTYGAFLAPVFPFAVLFAYLVEIAKNTKARTNDKISKELALKSVWAEHKNDLITALAGIALLAFAVSLLTSSGRSTFIITAIIATILATFAVLAKYTFFNITKTVSSNKKADGKNKSR